MLTLKHFNMEKSLQKNILTLRESPTTKYKKYDIGCKELKETAHKIHVLRIIEATLQSLPQLAILLTYLLVSSSFAFEVEESDRNLVILNILFTYISIILSYIHWTNMMKNNQLGFRTCLLLSSSATFLILGRMLPIIYLTSAASLEPAQEFIMFNGSLLEQTKDTSVTNTLDHPDILTPALAILLPFCLHWILAFAFYYFSVKIFHQLAISDKILHILINSFLPIPLRTFDCKERRRKSREMLFILFTIGLENIATLCFGFPVGDFSWSFIPGTFGLFSTAFHLAGCALLWKYYRSMHTWSSLLVTDVAGFCVREFKSSSN